MFSSFIYLKKSREVGYAEFAFQEVIMLGLLINVAFNIKLYRYLGPNFASNI